MKKLFVFVFIFSFIFTFGNKILIRIYNIKNINKNWDIASIGTNYVDIVIDKKELSTFSKRFTKIQQLKTNSDLSGYPYYNDLVNEMQSLANSYPNIISLMDIGDSYEKEKLLQNPYYNSYYHYHDILCLKISENVNFNDSNKWNFLIMAEHHARELETSKILMIEIDKLLNDYENGEPTITELLKNYNVYFVPMVNPDGYTIVRTLKDTMWRKNDDDNNGDHSYASYTDGVDLNRNYDWKWGTTGVDFSVTSEVYPGKNAFSEPESQAIRNLALQIHPIGSISYHSYGELVLFPFGYDYVQPPDYTQLNNIATAIAQSIGGYTPELSSILYPASGDSDDYLYGELGTFSFTVEIGNEFHPPYDTIPHLAENNYRGLKTFFKKMITNHIKGIVYDHETGKPISGVDYSVLQINNNSLTKKRVTTSNGHYYWNLPNGEYSMIFSKKNYNLKVVHFSIENNVINKNIYLTKAENNFIFYPIFPNPTKNSAFLGINIDAGYRLECSIFSISGKKIYTFPTKISIGNLINDSYFLSNSYDNGIKLASGIYIVNVKVWNKNILLFSKIFKYALLN